MTKTTQETGRSMVEMLGVLAVIGVLSVGAISGYTQAMNKHRANNVAADLMKRAMVISAQRQLGQEPNVQGLGSKVGEYELTSPISTDDDKQTFAMTVQDVPQEVCKKILALDWDNATISPDTAEGCNGDNMTFTYNNDLSPITNSGSTGGEGTDTPQEPTCTGTVCGANCCPTGATCGENNECCIGNLRHQGDEIECAPEGYEVYCLETNASGDCVWWDTCNGEHTGDSIVGVSGASGACAEEGYEIYCGETNESGDCIYWGACDGDNTGDSILGTYESIGCCVEALYANQHCFVEMAEVVDGKTHVEWFGCTDNYSTQDYALTTLNGVENGESFGSCDDYLDLTGYKLACGEWESDDNGTQYCSDWGFCPAASFDETTQTCN